jgi:hypothetical protein
MIIFKSSFKFSRQLGGFYGFGKIVKWDHTGL